MRQIPFGARTYFEPKEMVRIHLQVLEGCQAGKHRGALRQGPAPFPSIFD